MNDDRVTRGFRIHTMGELLKYTLFDRNMSQARAAEEIGAGVSEATISRMIQEKGFWVRAIIPVAKWCNISPEELWALLERET